MEQSNLIKENRAKLSDKKNDVKRILLLAGSNSPNSINRKVIEYVAALLKHNVPTIIDLRDYPLPIYSFEIEQNEGIPENAFTLSKIFRMHDAVVFSVAEHNGSLTAFFKNTLDWISRTQKDYRILENIPVLLLSASITPGGGRDAAAHAELIFGKRLRGRIVGKVSIPRFFQNVTVNKFGIHINNEEIDNQIRNAVVLLENELQRIKND